MPFSLANVGSNLGSTDMRSEISVKDFCDASPRPKSNRCCLRFTKPSPVSICGFPVLMLVMEPSASLHKTGMGAALTRR